MTNTDYEMLADRAKELLKDVPYAISDLANTSALIFNSLDDINWAGFYIKEGSRLMLGPFQGKPACVIIPFGKGVCGTAAAENRTVVVDDVSRFPGHIACDSASRSEIVIPVHRKGELFGVLDIDSASLSRFSDEDREGLEELVTVLEEALGRL